MSTRKDGSAAEQHRHILSEGANMEQGYASGLTR
jgi:hypothetical protein